MSTEFDPLRLDVQAFARDGATLSVNDSLLKYERIMSEIPTESSDLPLSWAARGDWRESASAAPAAWLHLEVSAAVPVICQRCMTRLDSPVSVNTWFRFVADEATAEAEDEDDTCEEDLLVTNRAFDLRALVEDEVLLALPMVPMHEVCPDAPAMSVADPDFDDAVQSKPNPFAVLKGLR